MIVLRTSNFHGATIRPIFPRHKHSFVFIISLGTIGLIVAPWKFNVLNSNLFVFKNIKFPRGDYQPIVPRQKHSI